MFCDLCGVQVSDLEHECSSCGHGICPDCLAEMNERFSHLSSCFWWACSEYHKIELEAGVLGTLELNAQRFGALSGWTTELAEDSIVAVPQLMFSEMAEAMAEQEERAMIGGDQLTLDELDGLIDTIEDQGHRATELLVRPEVAARLRQAEEYNNQPLIPTPLADNLVERVRWNNQVREIFSPAREVGRTEARENIIADRRRISYTRPSGFEQDFSEIRVTERIQFAPQEPSIANITDMEI